VGDDPGGVADDVGGERKQAGQPDQHGQAHHGRACRLEWDLLTSAAFASSCA
jgi:hypothetical protein